MDALTAPPGYIQEVTCGDALVLYCTFLLGVMAQGVTISLVQTTKQIVILVMELVIVGVMIIACHNFGSTYSSFHSYVEEGHGWTTPWLVCPKNLVGSSIKVFLTSVIMLLVTSSLILFPDWEYWYLGHLSI